MYLSLIKIRTIVHDFERRIPWCWWIKIQTQRQTQTKRQTDRPDRHIETMVYGDRKQLKANRKTDKQWDTAICKVALQLHWTRLTINSFHLLCSSTCCATPLCFITMPPPNIHSVPPESTTTTTTWTTPEGRHDHRKRGPPPQNGFRCALRLRRSHVVHWACVRGTTQAVDYFARAWAEKRC